MPRDPRLYITVPLDFLDHPKVVALPDKAKLAFLDMNIYCREHGVDGDIPIATARAKWPRRLLNALVASDPTKPLVVLTDTHYVIREYGEHQLTVQAIEQLREERAKAGSKGGKASAIARANRKQPLKQLSEQTGSKREAESRVQSPERQTDDRDSSKPVTEVDAREVDQDEYQFASQEAKPLGIRSLLRVRNVFTPLIEADLTWADTVDLARALLELSTEHVRHPDAYLERVCANSPHEVSAAWDRIPRPGKAA